MTALKMTVDEALALADQWCAGLTMDADSKGWGAILLVLAEEVRRLRAENERLRAVVMNDPYAKYRDEIRAKGMTATPLRLGIAVGHAGDDLPSPYPKGTRGDQLYRDGLELGRLRRANEAGRAAAPEPPAQEPGTAAEIEALRAEVERLAKDAERYRWLRAEHEPADLPIAQVVWKRGNDPHADWVNLVDGGDLDRHIDAAMEASNAG